MRFGLGLWLVGQGFPDERVARVVGAFTLSQFDAFAAGAALELFPTDASSGRRGGDGRWPRAAAGAAMLATIPNGTPGLGIDTFGHHATTLNGDHVWGATVINLASAGTDPRRVARLLPAGSSRTRLRCRSARCRTGVYVLHLPMHYWLGALRAVQAQLAARPARVRRLFRGRGPRRDDQLSLLRDAVPAPEGTHPADPRFGRRAATGARAIRIRPFRRRSRARTTR